MYSIQFSDSSFLTLKQFLQWGLLVYFEWIITPRKRLRMTVSHGARTIIKVIYCCLCQKRVMIVIYSVQYSTVYITLQATTDYSAQHIIYIVPDKVKVGIYILLYKVYTFFVQDRAKHCTIFKTSQCTLYIKIQYSTQVCTDYSDRKGC